MSLTPHYGLKMNPKSKKKCERCRASLKVNNVLVYTIEVYRFRLRAFLRICFIYSLISRSLSTFLSPFDFCLLFLRSFNQANVICVVYAVDDAASFQRLRTHWLPTIRRALGPSENRSHVPIVLVGNKVCQGRKGSAAAALKGGKATHICTHTLSLFPSLSLSFPIFLSLSLSLLGFPLDRHTCG